MIFKLYALLGKLKRVNWKIIPNGNKPSWVLVQNNTINSIVLPHTNIHLENRKICPIWNSNNKINYLGKKHARLITKEKGWGYCLMTWKVYIKWKKKGAAIKYA